MTNEQLDSEIAERVMGWKQAADNLWPGRLWWVDNQGTHLFYADGNAWTPTTGIAQAWQVVERVRTLGWEFSITTRLRFQEGWHALFWKQNFERYDEARAEAATAPLAIVLASLKAVGVEGEE